MRNSEKGITLVEIIVVIFIVGIFSAILVSDFPKIKRQFALTRAVYTFSQDVKRVQDMGFSGVVTQGVNAKGYGIFIDLDNLGKKKYIIYADANEDQQYTSSPDNNCGSQSSSNDCIIQEINFSSQEQGVLISKIINTDNENQASINFSPPNPAIKITSLASGKNNVEIVFALETDLSYKRCVSINTAGLIEIKSCE